MASGAILDEKWRVVARISDSTTSIALGDQCFGIEHAGPDELRLIVRTVIQTGKGAAVQHTKTMHVQRLRDLSAQIKVAQGRIANLQNNDLNYRLVFRLADEVDLVRKLKTQFAKVQAAVHRRVRWTDMVRTHQLCFPANKWVEVPSCRSNLQWVPAPQGRPSQVVSRVQTERIMRETQIHV